MFLYHKSDDHLKAEVKVNTTERSDIPISRYLTGKFCEHLGNNIYHGMYAQILKNPTFGDWLFWGKDHPDGGIIPECDEGKIADQIRKRAERYNWPDPELLAESRKYGLAHWWIREGNREEVRVSPDAGPYGGRAQRVEVISPDRGIAQWTYLPLHRTHSFKWRVVVRSADISSLYIRFYAEGKAEPAVCAEIKGVSQSWNTFTGKIILPESVPGEGLFKITLTAPSKGQFVIARVLLYPDDHIGGCDPEVITFLKDSGLPVLRWPGGNFVSAYDWEDGIDPADKRPTRNIPVWGGVEPNLFGTDEFIAFCRAVGCEPMICINAGSGTPEQAARWVQYCNGSLDSPQGLRRAANGHKEPFNVKFWEIGNELYGKWQKGWTTAAGNADRFRRFAEAMRTADPDIVMLACGAPVLHYEDWNSRLITDNADSLQYITDHILEGGRIPRCADPIDVFRDFMAFPLLIEQKYRELRDQMRKADIQDPHVAVTELQLFGRLAKTGEGEEENISDETLVSPAALAESLYDTLFYHMFVRLAPFVDLFTHSATVNHGGGLRKERERVYANPCYYSRKIFNEFCGAVPCRVEISCAYEEAPGILELIPQGFSVPAVDGIAAVADNGDVLVSLVHRGVSGTVAVALAVEDIQVSDKAEVIQLSAEMPWSSNTLEEPEIVVPVEKMIGMDGNTLKVDLPPYSVTRVRILSK